MEGKSDYFFFFLLRTIALRYSIAYYLSYFPYWPSDYYLSETYVLATVITPKRLYRYMNNSIEAIVNMYNDRTPTMIIKRYKIQI